MPDVTNLPEIFVHAAEAVYQAAVADGVATKTLDATSRATQTTVWRDWLNMKLVFVHLISQIEVVMIRPADNVGQFHENDRYTIVKRPRVISDPYGNESISVRSVCYVPLTYDHRLIDGADAGRFVTTIKRRLEDAAFEAELGM